MKWTVFNLVGGLFWIAGLWYAKGPASSLAALFPESDHRLMVGLVVGLVVGAAGLLVLLWANLRNPA